MLKALEVKDYHKQPMGMVHGGVIDTMAEAAISYAAYYTQEGTWVGVNNNTDFIKAVTEGTIICEATPIKLGKRSQIWEAKLYNNDQECARSTVQFNQYRQIMKKFLILSMLLLIFCSEDTVEETIRSNN